MKKILKSVISVFAVILICYGTFVIADCIRLRDSDKLVKPLITIGEASAENRLIYNGLGYSVEYYMDLPEEGSLDAKASRMYGAEFRLFDCIRMWAWIS